MKITSMQSANFMKIRGCVNGKNAHDKVIIIRDAIFPPPNF